MTSGTARPPTARPTVKHDRRRRQKRRGRPDTCPSSRDRDEHRADPSEVQALQSVHVTDHPHHEIAPTEPLELAPERAARFARRTGRGHARAPVTRGRATQSLSAYRAIGRARPKKRTATIAVVSERMAGRSAAREIRYPAKAISATPKTTVSVPSATETRMRERESREREQAAKDGH